jgi:hypothetical protein
LLASVCPRLVARPGRYARTTFEATPLYVPRSNCYTLTIKPANGGGWLNAMLLAPQLVLLLRLSADRDVSGKHAIGTASRTVGWACLPIVS